METKTFIELTQSGSWYTLEIEYDGLWTCHKEKGKAALNQLIADLIHDVKLDERFDLIPQLEVLMA